MAPPQRRILETLRRAALDGAKGVAVEEVVVGAFWTVVRTTCGTGISSSLRNEPHRHGDTPVRWAGSLAERSAEELLGLLGSPSVAENAIGLATVNALLRPDPSSLVEVNAAQVIRRRGAGRRVAVVGHFPFVETLERDCAELWVFERGLGRREGDLPEERLEEFLPEADVVAVTATTLLNGTLQRILALVRPGAYTLMLGPSTPLHPSLLDAGFDLLCGSVVEDPVLVVRAVAEGAVTRQIGGVRRVCLGRGAV
jgi:uncharacterized protein (DUF4213/DUF364 family)